MKFTFLLVTMLLIGVNLQAQSNNNIETRQRPSTRQFVLMPANVLINDYQIPLELAEPHVITGTIRDKENSQKILKEVTLKLISIHTNKEIGTFSYDAIKGTFRGEIKYTGTYMLQISTKGYMYHNELIRVKDITHYKEEKLDIKIRKLKK